MDGIPQGILSLNSRCSTNSTFQAREQGNDNTVPPCLGGGRPFEDTRTPLSLPSFPLFHTGCKNGRMPNNCVLPFVLPFVGDIHASKRSKTPFLLPRVRTLIKTSID